MASDWKTKWHLLGVLAVMSLSTSACSSATEDAASTTASTPVTTTAAVATTASTDDGATIPIPAPDGPFAVGEANLPLPDAWVYYPAQNDTGKALHRYIDPKLLSALELPAGILADQVASLTSSSRIEAAPLLGDTPRMVVVLQPGLGSPIALSTSLAEHLASHGYVVVTLQTDMAAEAALGDKPISTIDPARIALLSASFDLISSPAFENLVGPVDPNRIAVGGHSYAGSTAFNFSLREPRVAAVFDLDGYIRGEAATTATKVPSLLLTAGNVDTFPDNFPQTARANPNIVAVGLVNAGHYDFTDAASIGDVLRSIGQPFEVGTIGPVATSNTSVIVQRFLDAALSNPARLPGASALIDDLPSTTVNVLAE